MKMTGPYAWVPPAYWYADKLGGAFGFDSEASAGASIPPLDDLTRMLSPQELEALWKYPQVRQYHASAAWSTFARIEPFDTALARRYGPPKSLADYVAKSQLENYDNVRAQFEAFNAHMDAAKPLDRRHLLDAQQRVALAALASVRLFPESGRRLLRRQDGQRAGAHPVLVRHARDHAGQSHARR